MGFEGEMRLRTHWTSVENIVKCTEKDGVKTGHWLLPGSADEVKIAW